MLALACLWLCGFSRRAVQELLDENLMAAEEPTRLWPEEPKSPYGWTPFQTPPLQASTQAHAWHAGSNNPMGGHDCKHWLTEVEVPCCDAVVKTWAHEVRRNVYAPTLFHDQELLRGLSWPGLATLGSLMLKNGCAGSFVCPWCLDKSNIFAAQLPPGTPADLSRFGSQNLSRRYVKKPRIRIRRI